MSKSRKCLVVLLVVPALVMSACSAKTKSNSSTTGTQQASGGSLKIGLGAMWPLLDPYVAISPPRSFFIFSLFSMLTQTKMVNGEVKVVPSVAKSWKQTTPTTWTFNLNTGIKFPNGEPLDAKSVVASANYMIDPANKEAVSTAIPIKSANAINATTVELTTANPVADLPNYVSAMALLPPKALNAEKADFFKKPIGTGPWKVDSWTPGQKLVLSPNRDAFGPKPKATQLTFQLIAEDPTRIAALRSGQVDVINAAPTDQLETLKSNGFAVTSAPSPTYIIDIFKKSGILANQQVRQALNYAVDKQSLVDNIMGGNGSVADGQLPAKGSIGYCPSVQAYPYDPDKAKQLLAAAGVPQGTKLTFQTSNNFIVNDVLLANAVAQMLDKVGLSIQVTPMEFTSYLDVYHGQAPQKDLFSWRNSESPFLNAMEQYAFYRSGQTNHSIGYSNPAFDSAFETAESSPPDSTQAQEAYCTMAKTLHDDAPVIFGIAPPDLWATAKNVSGFSDDLINVPTFTSLAK